VRQGAAPAETLVGHDDEHDARELHERLSERQPQACQSDRRGKHRGDCRGHRQGRRRRPQGPRSLVSRLPASSHNGPVCHTTRPAADYHGAMPETQRRRISPAMQDYLKAVLQLGEGLGGAVSTQALAERLGVSTASVTGMVKRLAALRLLAHEPYHGVRLTERGEAVALEVLRHHRLLELYLVEHLGMTWDEVHAEADRLEHHISEGLEDRIAAKLGQPRHDPHGDPIPARDGSMVDVPAVPLATLEVGSSGTITRVVDRTTALLQYLAERGLRPGATVAVVAADELGGVMTVEVDGDRHALAFVTAAGIMIAA
jgi:DtxR family Mn-dependent transcriptional regulator